MTSSNGMESRALEMRLRRLIIKMWALYQGMDGRLKNPYAIKVVCRFMVVSNTYPRNAYAIAAISNIWHSVSSYNSYTNISVNSSIN